MSRVYFHSLSGEAELLGSERAWLGGLCTDVALGLLDIQHKHDRIRELIAPSRDQMPYPEPFDFARFQQWRLSVETSISIGWGDGDLAWNGKPIDVFSLVLNTACRVGGDPLRLAARIHGQCEIHGWCEGKDRAWLAGIIDEGLSAGLFRKSLRPGHPDGSLGDPHPMGWENVTALLRSRDDEPVVMSYSVCDQFPNRYEAGWEPPEGADLRPSWYDADDWATLGQEGRESYHAEGRDDAWYQMPDEERWRIAMEAHRNRKGGLRLTPDDWDTYHFGHNLSALDLIAPDWRERLDRAFADDSR